MEHDDLPVVKILAAAISAGPLFLSLLFNFAGFGVLTVQVYLYYLAFPNDPSRSKTIVYSVYILELVQTVLISRTLYKEFVFGFLDIDSLDRIGDIWFAVPIAGAIVTFIVQSFYVHRILLLGTFLGRRRVLAIACAVIFVSFAQMAAGFTLGAQMFQVSFYSKVMVPRIQASAGVWYAGGAICDIVIAVCMTSILLRSSDGTMPRTRKIVRKLVRLTIEAGTLTAAMGIITIAFVMIPSPETYYQTSAAVLSKLYSNTMMVVLNSRMELSNGEVDTRTSILSGVKFARMPVEGSRQNQANGNAWLETRSSTAMIETESVRG